MAGLVADGRQIVSRARAEASGYKRYLPSPSLSCGPPLWEPGIEILAQVLYCRNVVRS